MTTFGIVAPQWTQYLNPCGAGVVVGCVAGGIDAGGMGGGTEIEGAAPFAGPPLLIINRATAMMTATAAPMPPRIMYA